MSQQQWSEFGTDGFDNNDGACYEDHGVCRVCRVWKDCGGHNVCEACHELTVAPQWDEIGGSEIEPIVFGGWEDVPTRTELVVERTAREYQALLRTWHWTAGAPRMLAAPHCYPV